MAISLRQLLDDWGYSEEGIRRRLHLDRLDEYAAPPSGLLHAPPMAEALDALIRLFFQSIFVEEAAVTGALAAAWC